MGLLDRWREAKEASQEAVGALPADIDELRSDLRECVERIHPADLGHFLGPYRSWGDDVEALSPEEPILAAAPADLGMLVLTSERLLFGGMDGRAEMPLRELSVSRLETTKYGDLKVFTDAGGDRYHKFDMSSYKQETRSQFFQALTEAVREATKPVASSHTSSVADELEKFAALRNQGVLTEGEFEKKKRDLLS